MHISKEKYYAFCPNKYMLQKNICLGVDKSWKCGSQVDVVSFVKAKSFLSDVYFISTFFRGPFREVFQNNLFYRTLSGNCYWINYVWITLTLPNFKSWNIFNFSRRLYFTVSKHFSLFLKVIINNRKKNDWLKSVSKETVCKSFPQSG